MMKSSSFMNKINVRKKKRKEKKRCVIGLSEFGELLKVWKYTCTLRINIFFIADFCPHLASFFVLFLTTFVFIGNPFEMRLLNLRIIFIYFILFFIADFCPHFSSLDNYKFGTEPTMEAR